MIDTSHNDAAPEQQLVHASPEPLHWFWRLLLFILWAGVACVPIWWVDILVDKRMGDWSLGYWLLAQGSIIFFVVLTAVYAWAANRSERVQKR